MSNAIPPHRESNNVIRHESMTDSRDAFMMDFENACLRLEWKCEDSPKGNTRYLHKEWATMIQSQVYPNHSDVDWYEYVEWVVSGGGDEWFEVDEPNYGTILWNKVMDDALEIEVDGFDDIILR